MVRIRLVFIFVPVGMRWLVGVCNLDEQLVSLFLDLGWDELVRVIVSLLRIRSILMCYSNLL